MLNGIIHSKPKREKKNIYFFFFNTTHSTVP